MLGHRGCRLGIAYPEITEMQARAILEAAAELMKQESRSSEIMIPLVGHENEFKTRKIVPRRGTEKQYRSRSTTSRHHDQSARGISKRQDREAPSSSASARTTTQMGFGFCATTSAASSYYLEREFFH